MTGNPTRGRCGTRTGSFFNATIVDMSGNAFAFYVAGLIPLIESYKFQNIEVASAVLVLFNIIILTFVGYLYFNEKIGWLEVLGLIFAGLAIMCLEFAG